MSNRTVVEEKELLFENYFKTTHVVFSSIMLSQMFSTIGFNFLHYHREWASCAQIESVRNENSEQVRFYKFLISPASLSIITPKSL